MWTLRAALTPSACWGPGQRRCVEGLPQGGALSPSGAGPGPLSQMLVWGLAPTKWGGTFITQFLGLGVIYYYFLS